MTPEEITEALKGTKYDGGSEYEVAHYHVYQKGADNPIGEIGDPFNKADGELLADAALNAARVVVLERQVEELKAKVAEYESKHSALKELDNDLTLVWMHGAHSAKKCDQSERARIYAEALEAAQQAVRNTDNIMGLLRINESIRALPNPYA